MSERIHTKFLIIGAGPAGYTAAIYGARANLNPILIQGLQPGGQLMITTDVENYPGFADVIQGPWLMEEMAKQAEHVGTKLVSDIIVSCDLSQRPFVCTADSGDVYIADALAICTGAQARWLGLPSEDKYRGAGVSACATCDGFFFRGAASWWWAAATPRSRKRSTSPITASASRWSIAATHCAPKRSCSSGCSIIPRLR